MMKQDDIATIFEVDQSEVSRMLSKDPEKRRKPTYSFSLKLKSYLGGAVEEWREADIETLNVAFRLILELKAQEQVEA